MHGFAMMVISSEGAPFPTRAPDPAIRPSLGGKIGPGIGTGPQDSAQWDWGGGEEKNLPITG